MSRAEDIVTTMQNYEVTESHRLKEQLEKIPPQFRGQVSAIMQYKYLRGHLNNIITTLISHITPSLVEPMKGLASSLLYFADALADNLGTYYAVWGLNKGMILGVLQNDDPQYVTKRIDEIFQGTLRALATCKNLKQKSDELIAAMDAFQSALIEISGKSNTEQLEKDVRAAYAAAEEHMMLSSKYQRDLAIAKATLAQVRDTSKSDEEIRNNLDQRLKLELDSAATAQKQLQKAISEDGKVSKKTPHGYWGDWWWLGGSYSYTTRTVKDTATEQSAAQTKIRMADDRVKEIQNRIGQTSYERTKLRETAEGDAVAFETRFLEANRRAEEAFKIARQMENKLSNARLEAAGCSEATRKAITASFSVAFPLFQRLAESVSQVGASYEAMKVTIASQSRLGLIELITITDELMKLAILGEYSSNNTFHICADPVNVSIEMARTVRLQAGVNAIAQAPYFDPGKTAEIKKLAAPEVAVKAESSVFKVDISDI